MEVPDDGAVFEVAGIESAPIRGENEYPGVCVRTGATIAGARLPFQIDVGFDDVITPETVFAEKTEVIVSLGIANSRMKDFYDLWMIAQTFAFEGDDLAAATQQTFERRRTPLPERLPVGLNDRFAP